MSDKTRVKITTNDPHGLFKEGDVGFVDGYIDDGNGRPSAVVFLETHDRPFRVVLVLIEYLDLQ